MSISKHFGENNTVLKVLCKCERDCLRTGWTSYCAEPLDSFLYTMRLWLAAQLTHC